MKPPYELYEFLWKMAAKYEGLCFETNHKTGVLTVWIEEE